MLKPRIIPALLLSNKGVYKTVNFESKKYIGDPLNIIKIFNDKFADEIMIFDIWFTNSKKDVYERSNTETGADKKDFQKNFKDVRKEGLHWKVADIEGAKKEGA